MAFQPEVMVCPPGRVKARDQPLIAVLPVLVMVRFSVRPVFHALTAAATRHAPVAGVDGDGAGRRTDRATTGRARTGRARTGVWNWVKKSHTTGRVQDFSPGL